MSEQYTISAQVFRIARSILVDLMRKEKIRDTQELSDTFVSVFDLSQDHRDTYLKGVDVFKEDAFGVFLGKACGQGTMCLLTVG